MAKKTVTLNPVLITTQKISKKNINELYELHRELDEYLYKLEKAKYTDSYKCARYIAESAEKIRNIEFSMQKEWKFDLDEKKHTHWSRNPFCSCNEHSNSFGLDNAYNINCVVHLPRIYAKYFNEDPMELNSPIIADLSSLTEKQKEIAIKTILKVIINNE